MTPYQLRDAALCISTGYLIKTSALEPVELRHRIGGLGGIQTLTRSLQDFYALGYITSPISLVAVSGFDHQPRAYETTMIP